MPRRKSTKPATHITQVDCGNPYQRTITLIESDIHPGVHVNQKRTDILPASIRLAWNIVFSEHGRKAAAQALFEKWVSAEGGIIDPDELLAEAVGEVNIFEKTHSLTVEVGWMIRELTEVDGEGQSVRTKLYNWVSDVQKFTAQYLETCVQEVRGEKGGEGRMSRKRGKGTIIEKSEEEDLERWKGRRPTELLRPKEGLPAVMHLTRNEHPDTDIPYSLPFLSRTTSSKQSKGLMSE
jgi:hypothetical protein